MTNYSGIRIVHVVYDCEFKRLTPTLTSATPHYHNPFVIGEHKGEPTLTYLHNLILTASNFQVIEPGGGGGFF